MKEGLYLHINLRNEHNHQASCADAVIRREVSGETVEKLKKLFESGHMPSSALKELKNSLRAEEQGDYVYVAADRSVCPDLQFCYRLVTNQSQISYTLSIFLNVGYDISTSLGIVVVDILLNCGKFWC